ncbi:hypothetical protein ON010_g9532 [Phytophthora cinnamomi]|nr:hypothetical protein ON010_g9532 [Phytophthora cinnamomi]
MCRAYGLKFAKQRDEIYAKPTTGGSSMAQRDSSHRLTLTTTEDAPTSALLFDSKVLRSNFPEFESLLDVTAQLLPTQGPRTQSNCLLFGFQLKLPMTEVPTQPFRDHNLIRNSISLGAPSAVRTYGAPCSGGAGQDEAPTHGTARRGAIGLWGLRGHVQLLPGRGVRPAGGVRPARRDLLGGVGRVLPGAGAGSGDGCQGVLLQREHPTHRGGGAVLVRRTVEVDSYGEAQHGQGSAVGRVPARGQEVVLLGDGNPFAAKPLDDDVD